MTTADTTVCVVGLGKIGLPLAVQFASRGVRVIGADIADEVVDLVNSVQVPFPGEAELPERLAEVVAAGRLTATTDTSAAVAESNVVVVVVPLVVDFDGVPEFRALDAATEAIGRGLQPETLVIYETTIPVHTTRQRFAPRLAELSGLELGSDLFAVFSPERVYSGRIFADLRRYPKLVGGLDQASADRASDFYAEVLEFDERDDLARPNGVWDLGSAEAAELAKLAETTYRDINIAFANELAMFSEGAGIDVFGVIEAANSQPFSHIHQPGIAVGGHCIPVYPKLFLSNAPDALVPRAARSANEDVPRHVIERLSAAIGGLSGTRVLVLGAAYRGGVKETAFSGVFPLNALLAEHGAEAFVHDPLYTDAELESLGLTAGRIDGAYDAAIIQTDHDMYRDLGPSALSAVRVLADGRRVTDPAEWQAAGVVHLQLGLPT